MSVLDVRRHAERGLGTALTPKGEASAQALRDPTYTLVVSSPLERAQRTAELIGGRLDSIEPGLLPDIGGAQVFGPMATLAEWRALLRIMGMVGGVFAGHLTGMRFDELATVVDAHQRPIPTDVHGAANPTRRHQNWEIDTFPIHW